MNKSFQAFAYVFLVIVGAWMFGFTADGRIIKICIACNSFAEILLGVIAMALGAIGLAGTISSKKTAFSAR